MQSQCSVVTIKGGYSLCRDPDDNKLIETAIADARSLGVKKLFALTYEKEFFLKQGFRVIDRQKLPDKVWRECIACPKADACDEIAMVLPLGKRARTPAKGKAAG